MKNKKAKLSALLILLGIGFHQGYAQQTTIAAGGDASGSGGSVAYSVGQVVYTAHTQSSETVVQGVQQPYEISIITGLEETGIKINLSAYPNPTTNYLMLAVDDYTKDLSYELCDINGKLLETNAVESLSTTIHTSYLPAAIYFLKVNQNNVLVKNFKIIKN